MSDFPGLGRPTDLRSDSPFAIADHALHDRSNPQAPKMHTPRPRPPANPQPPVQHQQQQQHYAQGQGGGGGYGNHQRQPQQQGGYRQPSPAPPIHAQQPRPPPPPQQHPSYSQPQQIQGSGAWNQQDQRYGSSPHPPPQSGPSYGQLPYTQPPPPQQQQYHPQSAPPAPYQQQQYQQPPPRQPAPPQNPYPNVTPYPAPPPQQTRPYPQDRPSSSQSTNPNYRQPPSSAPSHQQPPRSSHDAGHGRVALEDGGRRSGSAAGGQGGSVSSSTARSSIGEAELWSMFSSMDITRSGQLAATEVQQLLSKDSRWKIQPREDCVKMLMNIFDTDRSGSISYPEFEGLYRYIKDWHGIFERFDRDRSGTIDRKELEQALQSFGYPLPPDLVRKLEKRYVPPKGGDSNAPRGVTFDRFLMACVTVKHFTEAFRRRDIRNEGKLTLDYSSFMDLVLDAPS